jgi:glycosyltransferase 2 family protein
LRERISPTATFATILIERLFDTTMVVTLFAVNLLFIELPGNRQSELDPIRSIGLLLVIGVVVGVILLILLRLKAVLIISLIERCSPPVPKKLVQPLVNFMRHLAEGLVVLTNLRLLLITIFYTSCVWGLVSAATWFSFYGFGLKYPFSYVIFVLGFGMVGSVVPTPGGSAGAYHAAASKALEFLGLDPNLAASIAIIHHLIAFGPPFFIALYFLIRDDISLGQIREMLSSEEPPPTEIHKPAAPLSQDKLRSH